jgi:hypothetical protein
MSQIQIFLSDILSPESAHVNVHIKDDEPRLHVFLLHKAKISPVRYTLTEIASHSASFASAVICTRPTVQDVIISDPTYSQLFVITSHGQTSPITTPSGTNTLHSSTDARLVDAVDSRITVQLTNGSVIRMDVDMNVRHTLTQQCLSALAAVLDREDFLRVKTATLTYYRKKSQHWTFQDFGRVVLSILGVLKAPKATLAEVHADPWQALLNDISDHRETHLENVLSEDKPPPAATSLSNDAICAQSLSSTTAPHILQALHVVAEDKRLVANQERNVLSLANLIISLASHYQLHAWVDYWLRSAPSSQRCLSPSSIRESSSCLIEQRQLRELSNRFDVPNSTLPGRTFRFHSVPWSSSQREQACGHKERLIVAQSRRRRCLRIWPFGTPSEHPTSPLDICEAAGGSAQRSIEGGMRSPSSCRTRR